MALPGLPRDASPARVLVVDDDTKVVELLSASLTFQGFDVDTAFDAAGGLRRARARRPNAMILDVGLPDMDGFEVLRRLRSAGINTPVLFLTDRDALQDRITGLNLGGDDCISKPFDLEELILRLGVVLRRVAGPASEHGPRLVFADIELNEDSHEVLKAGVPVSLGPTEFAVLRYFMLNVGTALSKQNIVDHVWPYDFAGKVNLVETYVSFLRHKVDREERLLHTLRGVGYIMRLPQ
jgi:two-component system OmpR family response regulator